MFARFTQTVLLASALFLATQIPTTFAAAADWEVSAGESRLIFNYEEDGDSAVGGFDQFEARAQFDPDAPESARMTLEIDVDSVRMPDPFRTGFVKGPDWFDTGAHPKATFELTSMTRAAQAGMFMVEGVMTIKGVSKTISAPTLVVVSNGRALARGELTFDRRDFGVDGEAPIVSIAPEVTVVFSLVARKPG